MEEICRVAGERIEKNRQVLAVIDSWQSNEPEGSLRTGCSHGCGQYYWVHDKGNSSGTYIKKADTDVARALAQKDYHNKMRKAAEYEIRKWEALLQMFDGEHVMIEDVYKSLPLARQNLVNPICTSDEEYARQWKNVTYTHKPFEEDDPEYYTALGERVRSKSEILIANQMLKAGIPYHYEKPLKLKDGRIIHPDFTVLHKRKRKTMYLEHFGKMGDPDYVRKNLRRIKWYTESGICPGDQLFITGEMEDMPLNTRNLEKLLQIWFL